MQLRTTKLVIKQKISMLVVAGLSAAALARMRGGD